MTTHPAQSAASPLGRLLAYSRSHRPRILAASLCSIFNKIFDLAPPLLIGAAVDVVVERENSFVAGLGFPDPTDQLWLLGWLTLAIWGLESVFQYAFSVLWRNLAQTLEHELRLDAYSHVQGLELSWFEERQSGGLLAILNDDINQLERFLDEGANELLQVLTTAIVISGLFFYMAPNVAWMAMGPIPLILWGSFYFQKRLAPRYTDVRERVGLLSEGLAGNLGGIATIKSFTAEAHEVQRVGQVSREYRESNRRAIRLSAAFVPLIRMVIVMGFLATLVYGGILALGDGSGNAPLSAGVYSVLVFLTQRLLWPMTRLGNTFDLYQRAMASTTRVLDLIDTPAKIVDGERHLDPAKVRGEVSFDSVNFAYSEGTPTLVNLSLHAPAGETTAIVGPTGSGKSTLLKLLLRFYDPNSGQVKLDGISVDELKLNELRQCIGFVSQDVFLFHGSVRDNIAYGSFGASFEEVQAAACTAEADAFVNELPQGYDTIVGERGQLLSGGQRQRLSLARAILKDPPILVLDEATSAVDNETEAAIQRSLALVSKNRTTLIVAHRLSTVRHAHRIHVLDRGQLVESGRHDQLVEADGIYAGLWRVQTGSALMHSGA